MNKKTILIVSAILISFALLGGTVGIMLANIPVHVDDGGLDIPKKKQVKITTNKTKNIDYETYNNGLVSMKIPKGWQVKVHPGADHIHYTFMVENPKNKNYRIYFNMKTEGYLSSNKEKAWYASLYPSSPMAMLPPIKPQTVKQFYKIYTKAARLSDTKGFVSPTINKFTVVETLGTNATGGKIVRATYKNENHKKIDGIFTATIKPVSLYYVTALNVYNTVFFTTPEGELTNWEGILNRCVGTIKFSDKFVNSFNNQEKILSQTSESIANIANQTSDIITSGWEQRQSTYDIISQKRSDATMGYERVYDTETGDIYKADSGFTSHDWNGKYKSVTDDMYNLPTSGYIEKVD